MTCAYHPTREASSRCMGCGLFYCRECVTETAGRMLCRRCLEAAAAPAPPATPGWRLQAGQAALAAAGVALLFVLFSLALGWLGTLPAHFLIRHGG